VIRFAPRFASARIAFTFVGLCACLPYPVSVTGKECDSSHPCPEGLPCNPYSLTCTTVQGCPYDPPSNSNCQGSDIYISPTGSDNCVGDTTACPRKTLPNPIGPGDRVHLLGGTYDGGLSLSGLGTADCPISLDGTNGAAVLQGELDMWGSHWRINNLTMQSTGRYYEVLTEEPLEDIVFQGLTFRGTCVGSHLALNSCDNCAVVACTFPSIATPAVSVEASSLNPQLLGNVVSLAGAPFAIEVDADNALVEGNDFSGSPSGGIVLSFHTSIGGLASRNVFHDLHFAGGGVGIETYGTTTVQSNTFIRMSGARSAADRVATFQDNIVSGPTYGETPVRSDGGYNLFDTGVVPYQNAKALPTDVVGPPLLQTDFVPMADSPAIGAADPSLPVPPGGGSRADIGAFQHGSTRLPDGEYCMPPGG
jgi:hypothetical protein